MPLGYGGGINNMEQIEKLFYSGVEKVIINSAAFYDSELITNAVDVFGGQSVIVSMDVKKDIF